MFTIKESEVCLRSIIKIYIYHKQKNVSIITNDKHCDNLKLIVLGLGMVVVTVLSFLMLAGHGVLLLSLSFVFYIYLYINIKKKEIIILCFCVKTVLLSAAVAGSATVC